MPSFYYIGQYNPLISKRVSISVKTVPIGDESVTVEVQVIGLELRGGSFTRFRKRRMLNPPNTENGVNEYKGFRGAKPRHFLNLQIKMN